MAIDTKIITNLDGSLTVASKQDDKAVKKVADFKKKISLLLVEINIKVTHSFHTELQEYP